jgi:hypothetical protein
MALQVVELFFCQLEMLGVEMLGVTHLKDIVKAQYHPLMRSETILIKPWRYHHLHHYRSFIRFRCQSLLHQSPIRIKVTMV